MVVAWAAGAWLSRTVGAWLGLGCAALVLGAWALAREGPYVRTLLRPRADALGAGIVAGVAMTVASKLLYPPLAARVPLIASDVARLYGELGAGGASASFARALALVPVILGEELVWRGVVQGAIAHRMGSWWAILLGTLLYALAHAPLGSPVLVATAFACGLAWSGLRLVTAGLVAPLFAHLIWDEMVLLVVPVLPRF
jgi:membrane protease YdiL (CAAX protease family)